MKTLFAFIFSTILIFTFALWSNAGQIISPTDLMCSKKPFIEFLWPADKEICSSGYAIFIKHDGTVEGFCLSKEDLKILKELYEDNWFYQDWRLENPGKDPCKGYKE